jgi:hypothetical protein
MDTIRAAAPGLEEEEEEEEEDFVPAHTNGKPWLTKGQGLLH